jgi:acetyl esterase/lipase
MNKRSRNILKALSMNGIQVKASRKLANLKTISPMKVFYETLDAKVYNEGYEIPIRAYLPRKKDREDMKVILYLHGGGWATESIDTYARALHLLAYETDCVVVAVEYRLAPEHKYPVPLEDCYAAAKALFTGELVDGIDPDKIIIAGDSAGGNMTAAVSLMARDRGEFSVKNQILIYPATYLEYENPPFRSVYENGSDYLLTMGKMKDYVNLYLNNDEERKEKYVSPLRETDFSNQPETMIITAEFDPLRDEGEAYGKKLLQAGIKVEIHRLSDAIHGFFSLGVRSHHMRESLELIKNFVKEEE